MMKEFENFFENEEKTEDVEIVKFEQLYDAC